MHLFFQQPCISDCTAPDTTGYSYGFTLISNGAAASVSCATGYEGTPNPGTVTCLDTGQWGTVSGCSIKGMLTELQVYDYSFNYKRYTESKL